MFRRWNRRSCSWYWPPSGLPTGWNGALPHRGTGQRRVCGHPAGHLAPQTATPWTGVRQTTARQNSVHLWATGGSWKQIPHNSVPVRVRETKPGPVLESDRNAGENLVPKQENQVEKAEPRGGQHFAAGLQLNGQSKLDHVWVRPRQFPPDFPQLQLWECDLPHGRWCSASIHWRALASIHLEWFCPADLLQSAPIKAPRTDPLQLVIFLYKSLCEQRDYSFRTLNNCNSCIIAMICSTNRGEGLLRGWDSFCRGLFSKTWIFQLQAAGYVWVQHLKRVFFYTFVKRPHYVCADYLFLYLPEHLLAQCIC